MSEPRQQIKDAVERVALAGALLLLAVYGIDGDYEGPEPLHFLALAAAAVGCTALFVRARWASSFTYVAVLLVAMRARFIEPDHRGSDVLDATNEAIGALFSGHNPYAHTYLTTRPAGSPFAYPPGELGFYTLAHLFNHSLVRIDLACGIFAIGIVATLVPFCGIGLTTLAMSTIGWAPILLHHTTDRSNDNAAAMLMLAGIATLMWSRTNASRGATFCWWASAVLFGWSLAFKEYTVPIVFFVAVFLWRERAARARGWTVAVLGTAAAFVLPFLLWNPAAFVRSLGGAVVSHDWIWGRNIWHDLINLLPSGYAIAPFVPSVTIAAVAGLSIVMWCRPARSLPAALLQGIAVVAGMFFFARWTTSVYYVFLLPLLVSAVVLQLGHDHDLDDLPAHPHGGDLVAVDV